MAVCTKFKITTWFLTIGPRIQRYSSRGAQEADDGSKNKGRSRNDEFTRSTQVKVKTPECFKQECNEHSFVSGASAKYMEYLFSKWVKNVNSVHRSWQAYFKELVEPKKKIPLYEKSPEKVKTILDDLDTPKDPSEPKPIEEIQKWMHQSNQAANLQSDGSNTWPPTTSPEQSNVVGHINLTPFKEAPNTLMSIKDLVEHLPKSKGSVTNQKLSNKPSEKTEHFPKPDSIQKQIRAGQKQMAKNPKKRDASGGVLAKTSRDSSQK